MPPFTAEMTLKRTLEKLAVIHSVSKSEIMRRAVKRGLAAMVREHKGKIDPALKAAFDAGVLTGNQWAVNTLDDADLKGAEICEAFDAFIDGRTVAGVGV